jgi:hypothetical protein
MRPAKSIGEQARRLLADGVQGEVIGVSSRGLFTQTRGGEVAFLSGEEYRGPLTVNIAGDASWLGPAGQDTRFEVGVDGLQLRPSGIRLLLDGAQTWSPPRRTGLNDSASAQRSRILLLARAAADAAPASGMATLTQWIALGFPAPALPAHPQAERCARLGRAIAEGDADAFSTLAEGLLGWGQGLTPSGDDFVVGMLLGLSRAGLASATAPSMLSAAARVVDLRARKHTTAISAGLLACAALGEADERLVALVDHVQTGSPGEAEARAAADGWGATSGWDALAGIGVTLSIFG